MDLVSLGYEITPSTILPWGTQWKIRYETIDHLGSLIDFHNHSEYGLTLQWDDDNETAIVNSNYPHDLLLTSPDPVRSLDEILADNNNNGDGPLFEYDDILVTPEEVQ